MTTFLVALAISLPIAWLIAEFKGGRALRIGLGVLTIVVLLFGLFTVTQVVRGYEKDFMRFSLRDMKQLLQAGRQDVVLSAIDTYEAAVRNETPFSFQGSLALHQSLKRTATNSEPGDAANRSQLIRSETNQPSTAPH